jgi:hypothetical protein
MSIAVSIKNRILPLCGSTPWLENRPKAECSTKFTPKSLRNVLLPSALCLFYRVRLLTL